MDIKNGWIEKHRWITNRWMVGCLENIDGWLDRQEKQKDGWMDGQKKQMDGWMDEQKKLDGYKNGRLD